eukprot:1186980-Ditylum_brightwellii.AAC.1
MKPGLTEEAREYIAARYAEMQSRQDERTLTVTARSLVTIICLASAHAKAGLSQVVEADPDCMAAMDILGFALYHKNSHGIASDGTSSKRQMGKSASITEESEGTLVEEDGNDAKRARLDVDDQQTVKAQIWDKINKTGDAQLEIGDVCKDIQDHSMVMEELRRMENDGSLMLILCTSMSKQSAQHVFCFLPDVDA